MPIPPFHLAFPVRDIPEARAFYGGLMGLPEGRSSEQWIDFNMYGHQVVTHLDPNLTVSKHHNEVDGRAEL